MAQQSLLCNKVEDLPINSENPWEFDKLNRKDVAEKFTNILKSINQAFVISINSRYGTGKTFFLKRWQVSLEKEDFVSLFYNAWDADFYEHAFVAFVYSLILQMKQSCLIDENLLLHKKLVKVVEELLGSAIPLMSTITPSYVEGKLAKLQDAVKNKESKKTFDLFKEKQSQINEFKIVLAEIVHEFKLKQQKLIIFVDELERCRPTHAVELLESIKHLFDVDGIIFVLGIDRDQLKHTISSLYGQGIDAEGYLRRFIDLELKLPTPNEEPFVEFLFDYHRLYEVTTNSSNFLNGGQTLKKYLNYSIKLLGLTLREISQCFTEINIALRLNPKEEPFLPMIFSFLACLKIKQPRTYTELGFTPVREIMNSIHERDKYKVVNTEEQMYIEGLLMYFFEPEKFSEYARLISSSSEAHHLTARMVLNNMEEQLNHPSINLWRNIHSKTNRSKLKDFFSLVK